MPCFVYTLKQFAKNMLQVLSGLWVAWGIPLFTGQATCLQFGIKKEYIKIMYSLLFCCPARVRTWTLLIQSQTCCQLHYRTILIFVGPSGLPGIHRDRLPVLNSFQCLKFWLTYQGSNLNSSEPKSDVLPITP
jgi:hypothetical protein